MGRLTAAEGEALLKAHERSAASLRVPSLALDEIRQLEPQERRNGKPSFGRQDAGLAQRLLIEGQGDVTGA